MVFPEVRQVVATLVAFAAPFIFISASNNYSFLPFNSALSGTAFNGNKGILSSSDIDLPPPIPRLQDYLRIRTDQPSPDYDGAIKYLNTTISTLLPHSKIEVLPLVKNKPILLATLYGTDPSLSSVLLNSHTDVVPAESEKWNQHAQPFEATILKDKNIYARGSQDMKSIGLQYVEALSSLYESSWKPLRTIHLIFVPDEEIGGHDGMKAFVDSKKFGELNIGVALDEGEPSENDLFNVFYGERRPYWFSITVNDSPGHGATFPETSATKQLNTIIDRIHEFRDEQLELKKKHNKDIGDVISINIAYLKAGSPTNSNSSLFDYAMNIIPSVASAGFDLRIPPSISNEDIEKTIDSWITCENGKKCSNVSIKFLHKVLLRDITSRDPDENPFIIPFAKSMHSLDIEQSLKHGTFFASTDSRFLRAKSVPCFGFSPIRNTKNLMHKHNEYISIDGYMDGIKIYKSIIKHIANFDPENRNNETQSEPDINTESQPIEKDQTSEESETTDCNSEKQDL